MRPKELTPESQKTPQPCLNGLQGRSKLREAERFRLSRLLLQRPDLLRAGLFLPPGFDPRPEAGICVEPLVVFLRSLPGREGKR